MRLRAGVPIVVPLVLGLAGSHLVGQQVVASTADAFYDVETDLVYGFTSLSTPALGNSGIGFLVTTNHPIYDAGRFRGFAPDPEDIPPYVALQAMVGHELPGNEPGHFASLAGFPLMNASGRSAFVATMSGTTGGAADDKAVFLGDMDPPHMLVREGDVAPGGGKYSNFLGLSLDDTGRIAVRAQLVQTSQGTADDQAIFVGESGMTDVAREGDPMPDGNGVIAVLGDPAIADTGNVVLRVGLAGTLGSFDNAAIVRTSGSGLQIVAHKGVVAPGGIDSFTDFDAWPAINRHDEVAFSASPSTGARGVFTDAGGTLVAVARKNQVAPDGNGSFSAFDPGVAFNDHGQVAFGATLVGTAGGTSTNRGVFLWDGTQLVTIVRTGDSAGNGEFDALSGVCLNEEGQVGFFASLRDTTLGSADDLGIFLWSPYHGVLEVVRKGDGLGGVGLITGLAWNGGQPFTGDQGSPINDVGESAFHFSTDQLVSGVAIAPDPSPYWADVGYALDGARGSPRMHGAGTLAPGATYKVFMINALENAPAFLVLGLETYVPFKGGTLVPSAAVLVPLVTSSDGGFSLQSTWPFGVPSGASLAMQTWIVDAAGPKGYAASNGLVVSAP